MANQAPSGNSDLAFGRLLRFWRGVHGLSQESLALTLECSNRHMSYLENGRAHPSRAMVERLASALSMGKRDRSQLLLSAGYTPQFEPSDFFSNEFKWLRKAMIMSLRALDPYPASLSDRYGKLLMVNRAWVNFYTAIYGAQAIATAEYIYDLTLSAPQIAVDNDHWIKAVSLMLMGLQQEALMDDDPTAQQLVERLLAYPSVPENWQQIAAELEPMTSFRLPATVNGKLEAFFSVSQTVGALGPASYIPEPRLTLSTLYPENEELSLDELLHETASHPLLFY